MAILVFVVNVSHASAAECVTGTTTFWERIAVVPDAVFTTLLLGASWMDAPAEEIGRYVQRLAGQPPYRFSIADNPERINPLRRYILMAMLKDGDWPLFTTVALTPVLTMGAPRTVDVLMRMVGGNTQGGSGAPPPAATVPKRRLPATFRGVLRCANCTEVRHHLDLLPDQAYHIRREWLRENSEATGRVRPMADRKRSSS